MSPIAHLGDDMGKRGHALTIGVLFVGLREEPTSSAPRWPTLARAADRSGGRYSTSTDTTTRLRRPANRSTVKRAAEVAYAGTPRPRGASLMTMLETPSVLDASHLE
jgi:hypothetical protein